MTAQNAPLKGKICLVVGASSGMGRRTAIFAGAQGAHVIAAARTLKACKETAQTIQEARGSASALKLDGENEASIAAAMAHIKAEHGTLDCVFNNLGSVQGMGPYHETPLERWHATLRSNLTSVFMLMKAQIPLLLESGGGVIINNSSNAGLRGMPHFGDYSAAKWGLIGLTRTVALEYGKNDIRCLAIAPGTIKTEKAAVMMADMPDVFDTLRGEIPLARFGTMDDIAGTVCWLMSDAARYITGVTIPIDGGQTA